MKQKQVGKMLHVSQIDSSNDESETKCMLCQHYILDIHATKISVATNKTNCKILA